MNNLRSALSKQAEAEVSVSRTGSAKPFPKGKNASIWAIDPEQEQQDYNQQKDKLRDLLQLLQRQLQKVHKKDATFTEMSFYEIMESIQGNSQDPQELSLLQSIQDNSQKPQHQDQSLQEFAQGFYEYLNRRIKKLRKKEKKNELQEYEKIVKTNFKKKGAVQFIDQDNLEKGKPEALSHHIKKLSSQDGSKKEGSASRLNGSNSSTEGNKLSQFLTTSKQKQQKSHHSDHNIQASITFSAIVSQNMTVRQRETRQKKKEKKEHQQSQQQDRQKPQGSSNNDAFIFYRPKAGKTK